MKLQLQLYSSSCLTSKEEAKWSRRSSSQAANSLATSHSEGFPLPLLMLNISRKALTTNFQSLIWPNLESNSTILFEQQMPYQPDYRWDFVTYTLKQ